MLFRVVLLIMAFETTSRAAAPSLAELANKALPNAALPGSIVTAERKGEKVHFSIAGKLDTPDTPPEHVLFEMGSITKVFTGLLLAQAIVEKKATLETTLGSILGEQAMGDPRVATITLKQLATHTSGLPRLPNDLDIGSDPADPYAHYDSKRLLNYLKTAKLEKRDTFPASYSNLGVGLLGFLLGHLYQSTWDKLVIEKICLPLGLRETFVTIPEKGFSFAAAYSGKKQVKPWRLDALAGAGALRTTASDLMTFAGAFLKPESTPLKEALALTMTPQAEAPSLGGQIGLCLIMHQQGDSMLYEHNGGTGGFRSSMQIIPAKQQAYVILANNADFNTDQIAAAATTTTPIKPQAKPKEITLETATLQRFVGSYELDADHRFTVLLHQDKLWVRLSGQPFIPLYPSSPTHFFYKVIPAEIEFSESAGKVTALTLFQNGREMKASRSDLALPSITLRDAKALQPYAGKYALMGLKELTVSIHSDTLFAQIEGQSAVPVFEVSPDRFVYDVVDAELAFSRNDKGVINGLTLLQNGLSIAAPRK